MLNHFLYHLVSGHAWFSCGFLFLLILVLDLTGVFTTRPRLARGMRLLMLATVAVAAASATPLSVYFVVPLLTACLAYALFGLGSTSRLRRFLLAASAGSCVTAALALELPYHLTQPPEEPRPRRLFVIADSLAAGMGREKITWPSRLAELTHVEVCDLSAPGATARSALRRQVPEVERLAGPGDWVLVSIGGNDMLGPTSAADFGEDLDLLLAAARGDPQQPRVVLMQELPLIPWAGPFGVEQRRAAAKHGVVLIPKRLLAGVVLDDENVLDGLHLSRKGHERMATELARWVGGVGPPRTE